jgi:hypothetical protein
MCKFKCCVLRCFKEVRECNDLYRRLSTKYEQSSCLCLCFNKSLSLVLHLRTLKYIDLNIDTVKTAIN